MWVEIPYLVTSFNYTISHTLTGVWVEISNSAADKPEKIVTPSRVCELKSAASAPADTQQQVTPSRVCELKFAAPFVTKVVSEKSHPHGCVSWNCVLHTLENSRPCVTPSRVCELKFKSKANAEKYLESHPHGCVSWNHNALDKMHSGYVTPSRVCELKFAAIYLNSSVSAVTPSRVCELKFLPKILSFRPVQVTPSRVCELKSVNVYKLQQAEPSHPHGCVSWNCHYRLSLCNTGSHTLTGVWVEISGLNSWGDVPKVTPSRVCELKSL